MIQRHTLGQGVGHRTQAVAGHRHVGGEAAVAVVARHELPPADRRPAGGAGLTVAAGDHRRHDHRAADPVGRPGTGLHPLRVVMENGRLTLADHDAILTDALRHRDRMLQLALA